MTFIALLNILNLVVSRPLYPSSDNSNRILSGSIFRKLFCNSPLKNGENIKNKINRKIVNIGKIKVTPFFPVTIGNEVIKPIHAFLEKVKNAEKPVDKRKLYATVFLKMVLPFSRNKAKQKGQTKFSQDAA